MRRRRRGCGCVSGLVALLLFGILGVGLSYGFDAPVTAPWAYGILGRPTLTGSWTGTLTTLGGLKCAVYLQINRSHFITDLPTGEGSATRGLAEVFGLLSWCARGVPSTSFTVNGTVDRSATRVSLQADERIYARTGLAPFYFQGAWHGSTLVLDVLFRSYQKGRYVESTAIPDEVRPVRVTLHKRGYADYLASCARI